MSAPATPALSAADFAFLAGVVAADSAIVIEPGKEYLVISRLLPVARAHGHANLPALVTALRTPGATRLRADVVEAMTTNETSFFRDTHPFDALTTTVLPDLIKARAVEQTLTVWCAACSSGQEPYSIAMLLKDALAGRPGWQAKILATDLSQQMLTRTAAGRYSQLEVNRGLPAARLVQNFERVGAEWQAKADLRAMIDTRAVNLAAPWPLLPRADIVFLRNVLIYFDLPTKQAILDRVAATMRPDGYLFLGAAESTLNLDTAFERTMIGRAPVYRLRGKA